MENKEIKEYNPTALKEIKDILEFSKYDSAPVKIEVSFTDFEDINCSIRTILNAIEFIGYNGTAKELGTCAGLAEIAIKLLPINELDFLDKLLIKNKHTENEFIEI